MPVNFNFSIELTLSRAEGFKNRLKCNLREGQYLHCVR